MAKEPTFVKKITMKVIADIPRDDSKAATIEKFMGTAKSHPDFAAISGDITGYGTKKGAFGENFYFNGSFVAINRKSGQIFTSSKIYLPNDLADNAVAAFNGRSKDSEGVHFHAHIQIALDPSSATGYTFVSQPIKTPESINREAELIAKLTNLPAPKQLAAPAKKN